MTTERQNKIQRTRAVLLAAVAFFGAASTAKSQNGVWTIKESVDRMTDQKTFSGELRVPAIVDGNTVGQLDVKATCDPEILQFKIVYVSKGDIGFKLNSYGDRVVPGGLLGALTMASSHKKPWVDLRVRMDRNAPVKVSSEDDFNNEAMIFFSARSTKGAVDAVDRGAGSTDKQTDDLMRLFLSAESAGTMDQAFAAQTILVELPLGDGSSTILEIKPQDPTFKDFASRCVIPPSPASTTSARPAGALVPTGRRAERFTGTAAAFAQAFPAIFKRAAVEAGFDPNEFAAEMKHVPETVTACAGITSEMTARVTDRFGGVHTDQLGPQYRFCGMPFIPIRRMGNPGMKPQSPDVVLSMSERTGNSPLRVSVSLAGLSNGRPFPVVRADIQ